MTIKVPPRAKLFSALEASPRQRRNGDTLWVGTSWGDAIARINTRTGDTSFVPLPYSGMGPYQIAVDSKHNAWFNIWTSDVVLRYDPSTQTWGTNPIDSLHQGTQTFPRENARRRKDRSPRTVWHRQIYGDVSGFDGGKIIRHVINAPRPVLIPSGVAHLFWIKRRNIMKRSCLRMFPGNGVASFI